MKRHKKPSPVWLGKSHYEGWYDIGRKKKDWDLDLSCFIPGIFGRRLCANDFERITGIKLEPDELVRVRITVEEV